MPYVFQGVSLFSSGQTPNLLMSPTHTFFSSHKRCSRQKPHVDADLYVSPFHQFHPFISVSRGISPIYIDVFLPGTRNPMVSRGRPSSPCDACLLDTHSSIVSCPLAAHKVSILLVDFARAPCMTFSRCSTCSITLDAAFLACFSFEPSAVEARL